MPPDMKAVLAAARGPADRLSGAWPCRSQTGSLLPALLLAPD
ncbi:hypothetical protein LHGZ1_3351 [Laribacter hongkongensis]|uniref:Uncharacterized protein n=1 Tax=Laribacter hongkongensis TaxID=168471 RepID=A0A248LNE3_9NEIS|nr:hypothetical protein LHGZ1_3351 [Laribacter hongkongensis]